MTSYTITDEYQLGIPVAVKVDALTGRRTAFYGKHDTGVVIGEPLLDCCDQPVSDGPCGCVRREVGLFEERDAA